jgi:hypothetical protein
MHVAACIQGRGLQHAYTLDGHARRPWERLQVNASRASRVLRFRSDSYDERPCVFAAASCVATGLGGVKP